MKTLKSYEKELKTCSKCGLCQSVCPVYKVTGKETIVSRGKFNLLLGLIKGDLNYTKKLDEALSLCLHCKACDGFCPSSIKATEIISTAKSENKKFNIFSKSFLLFKLKFIFLSIVFKIYRFAHLSKIVVKIDNFLRKFGALGKIFLLFDKISKINCIRKKTTSVSGTLIPDGKNGKKKLKVLYFEGCFTKYINPSTKNAVLNLLEKNNFEVIQKPFECCGLSALYNGNITLYNKLKEKNIKLLNTDCDYIVCDCATCLGALKEYNEPFSEKVIDILDLIQNVSLNPTAKLATYHLPCHLRTQKKSTLSSVEKIIPNYIQLIDNDVCCGFAGDFSLNFPKISNQISKEKAKNIEKTNAEYVLTSCPGCIIGLNKGLIEQNSKQKVMHIAEYAEKHFYLQS